MDGIGFISQVVKFIPLNEILEEDIWCVLLPLFAQIICNNRLCWLLQILTGDFPLEVPRPYKV